MIRINLILNVHIYLFRQEPGDDPQGFDNWKTYFEVPHWMHLSFISYDKEGQPIELLDQKQFNGTF